MQAQERLLRGILGVSEMSEHSVSRRERRLTQRLKFVLAHPAIRLSQSGRSGAARRRTTSKRLEVV